MKIPHKPHLTIGVPEGIGDILWVYRKVKPYTDTLDIIINHTGRQVRGPLDTIMRRSEAVIKSWPGVRSVGHRWNFRPWFKEEMTLADKFSVIRPLNNPPTIDLIFNRPLEKGIPLEDIDPGMPVMWGLELDKKRPADLPEGIEKKYLSLYVSGDTIRHSHRNNRWTLDHWVDFVRALDMFNGDIFRDIPIALVGAEFDRAALEYIAKRLNQFHKTVLLINKPPAELYYILKHSRFFVGYQSGLSMLADEFDTPQLMVYFDELKDMKDSWVKPANRTNGKYNYGYFSEAPKDLARRTKV